MLNWFVVCILYYLKYIKIFLYEYLFFGFDLIIKCCGVLKRVYSGIGYFNGLDFKFLLLL